MKYEFPSSKLTYIFRGLTHACPRCGSRKTHRNYFKIKEYCPKCELKFEKEHGYWTGALAVNFIITGGIVIVSLVAGLIATAPNIPVIPMMATLLPVGFFLPIISYPFSYTTWMAIDYGFLSTLDK